MTPIVLVPVNQLDRAKGRLAEILSPSQRAELALSTLGTVLAAVQSAGSHAIVLSADPIVRESVRPPHNAMDESVAASGLNGQLAVAIDDLRLTELLILHGDLPLISGDDLSAFASAAPASPSVTLVESADGGTNAMLLRPPDAIELHYGRDSATLHRQAAEEAHVPLSTVESPAIALDLDTPADIETLLATEKGRTSAAGRLLRSWGFETGGSKASL